MKLGVFGSSEYINSQQLLAVCICIWYVCVCMYVLHHILCYVFGMKALTEYALCMLVIQDPVVGQEKKDYFSNMLCGYF